MLGAILLLQLAQADGGPTLEWSAPPGCSQVEQVRHKLVGRSGRAQVVITELPPSWTLEVRTDDLVRELVTASCEEAVDAAVLILQVSLPSTPPPHVAAPAPAPPAAWEWRASLTGGASAGWLPQALGRFGASVSASLGDLSISLDLATALPARFAGAALTSEAAVTLHPVLDAQLGACWLFTLGPARGGPCAHGAVGLLLVRGEKVTNPRSTSLPTFAGGPGARVYVSLNSRIEVLAAGVVRFGTRPSVSFDGFPTVVEANVATFEIFGGVGIHLL